jgi:hypothetical protein
MSKFSGAERCMVCEQRVYFSEKLTADEKVFHKTCFRCSHCKKVLSLGTYASLEGKLYCKPHFKQLFKLKGNYNEGFGKKKITTQWLEKKEGGLSNDEAEEAQRKAEEAEAKREAQRQRLQQGQQEESQEAHQEQEEHHAEKPEVPKAQGYGSAKGTSSIKCKPRSRFFHHIP